MSQHLFRCVYAYKVNISRARQQRNRWPKQIFFGKVTLLPHLFLPPACRLSLRAETFLVASARQRRLFRLRIRVFSCAGDTYFSGDRLDKEAPASAAAGYGGVL